MDPLDFSWNPLSEAEFKWYDQNLVNSVNSDDETTHKFFRLLALCHTVMPEDKNGRLDYQAQSPDEAALVSAARNFGYVFRARTPNSITIEVKGQREVQFKAIECLSLHDNDNPTRFQEYELLSILDFNNVRKRMSVILRRNDEILLLCKGADNVIYDRLGPGQEELKLKTQEHLNVSLTTDWFGHINCKFIPAVDPSVF